MGLRHVVYPDVEIQVSFSGTLEAKKERAVTIPALCVIENVLPNFRSNLRKQNGEGNKGHAANRKNMSCKASGGAETAPLQFLLRNSPEQILCVPANLITQPHDKKIILHLVHRAEEEALIGANGN